MADYRLPGEWSKDGMVFGRTVAKEAIDRLESFEMSEGEVLLATYPKTGTTWLQELIWLVCNSSKMDLARSVPLDRRFPYLELQLEGSQSGIEMTHLRSETFRMEIEKGKVKVIIGIRNPKDTLVSFYHFYRMTYNLGNFSGSWDDFFELYKTKHMLYGDYFQWYSSWLQYIDKPNVMLVKYEDMHHRLSDVIKGVSTFLGKNLPENVMDDISLQLSFDSMRHNNMVNKTLTGNFNMQISSFMRKGKIGDWKNYFSQEQSGAVEKSYKDTIEPFGIGLEFE
ncbi:hypothetical protein LSH36_3123g00016 [Paralvinella palmiformis]|uniref:Sulfotransferase domain-containing protein n=1 Tax=Paralvinella palmiformis TaxID=53620 RepID=A0AAD9IQA6_9ANNE|nr:hypothetical protein LSH36_3123g00016 [Paralvinella palmiformis]